MKQKFQDLLLLLRRDRKYQLLMLVAVVGFVWAVVQSNKSPAPHRRNAANATNVGQGLSNPDETVRDITTSVVNEIKVLRADNQKNREELDRARKDMEENNERVAQIVKTMLARVEEHNKASGGSGTGGVGSPGPEDVATDAADPSNSQMAPLGSVVESPGMQSFEGAPAQLSAPPPPPPPKKVAVVGTGDHVRVKLAGAVHAATDGTPYPVLFKVMGDINGPNNQVLSVGDAFIVAAAQGTLTDHRALFRLTSLNLAYPDGRRNVIDVDGWVVGEDGIAGMEGVLIDPIGKAIAGAGMAGFVQGLGEGFKARNVTNYGGMFGGPTTEVTGDEREYAFGSGMSSAAETWSRLIENRVNKLVPVVEVLSDREGTAIFSRSFKIPDLIEAYQAEEDSYSGVN